MADPRVRHLDRLIQIAKDMDVHLGQPAPDASAVPDAVRPDAAPRSKCSEAVRGCLPSAWADALEEQKAALLCQDPLLPDALPTADYPGVAPALVVDCLPLAVVLEPLRGLKLELQMEPKAAQPALKAESESEQARSSEAHSVQVSLH